MTTDPIPYISDNQHKKNKGLFEFIKSIFYRNKHNSLMESVNELIKESEDDNSIGTSEREMLQNLVTFQELEVSDVMVPTTDIIGISSNATYDEVVKIVIEEEHTRYPIYDGTLDNIIGFIHVKDLIKYINKQDEFSIQNALRGIVYAPRSMMLIDLLDKMRQAATHIGVVFDEYGGTDGIITIENVIEKLVGDIKDEYDMPDESYIKEMDSGEYIIDARIKVEEFESYFNKSVSDEDGEYETLGGFIMSYLGYIPIRGEKFAHAGFEIEVVDADERRIKSVKLTKAFETAK